MGKVLAIAMLAVRNAVRSRVVLILLAILLLATVGLPLSIKGDGTVAGFVRILLGYTLGAVALTLSLATIWAGCAAVSTEVQERQLQLVVSKPVHRIQIWIGKWLGLVFLNAVLLAAAGAVTYGILLMRTRPANLSPDEARVLRQEILTARRPILPEQPDVEEEALRELAAVQHRGEVPAGLPAPEILRAIRQNLLRRAYTVPPGGTCAWRFDLPRLVRPGQPLLFRCRLSSSEIGYDPVPGRWEAGPGGGVPAHELEEKIIPTLPHSFAVPAEAFAAGGPLVLRYRNLSDEGVTVLFRSEDGMKLLVCERSFEANFLRALGLILAHLAFLSALGVAAGSLFSMPVAAFVSFCLLLIIYVGGYAQSATSDGHGHGAERAWVAARVMDPFVRVVGGGVRLVLRPLEAPNPLDLLATGELITTSLFWRLIAVKVLLYAGLMALFSAWVLNRREIALPSS